MTEEKKPSNSLAAALQAKKNAHTLKNQHQPKVSKSSKGFGGPAMVRRTGRGR